jgi:hypothetical protein
MRTTQLSYKDTPTCPLTAQVATQRYRSSGISIRWLWTSTWSSFQSTVLIRQTLPQILKRSKVPARIGNVKLMTHCIWIIACNLHFIGTPYDQIFHKRTHQALAKLSVNQMTCTQFSKMTSSWSRSRSVRKNCGVQEKASSKRYD